MKNSLLSTLESVLMLLPPTDEKEAAKLYGVYLWHKGVLNWLKEGNKPVNVVVKNKRLMATFSLWRNKEKIYTEATFYKKVHRNVFLYTLICL